jgi:2-oxoglutarate ferredoxin oxidoreductase subunit delta
MNSEASKTIEEGHKDGDLWRQPLDYNKFQSPQCTVHLIKDRCKGCEFCIEFCPRGVLVLSDEFNAKGYHPPKVINQDGCYACRLCELICPEFAIYINEEIKKSS